MNKLQSLKHHLLNAILGTLDNGQAYKIQPEDVDVFTTEGKVISHYARPNEGNEHFKISYTANIIVKDYGKELQNITYVVLAWLSENCPHHKEDMIEFEAQILNDDTVDLHMILKNIEETIKVNQTDQGVEINACHDNVIDPIIIVEGERELIVEQVNKPHSTTLDVLSDYRDE